MLTLRISVQRARADVTDPLAHAANDPERKAGARRYQSCHSSRAGSSCDPKDWRIVLGDEAK